MWVFTGFFTPVTLGWEENKTVEYNLLGILDALIDICHHFLTIIL